MDIVSRISRSGPQEAESIPRPALVRRIWRDVWTFEMKSSLPLMVPMPKDLDDADTSSAWKVGIMNFLAFT